MRLKRGVDFFDGEISESLSRELTPETPRRIRGVHDNSLLRVCDLTGVADLAQARGLVSIVDNTLATPITVLAIANATRPEFADFPPSARRLQLHWRHCS